MILDILIEPNEILHKKTVLVTPEQFSGTEIKDLIKKMIETMYAKDGVGLAASQVGKLLSLCVISKKFTPEQKNDLVLINPEWEKMSVRKITDEEGCLSVPNIFGKVKRYKKIKVRAQNAGGKKIEFPAEDFFARIIQHEVDHLQGILFIEKAIQLQHANPI